MLEDFINELAVNQLNDRVYVKPNYDLYRTDFELLQIPENPFVTNHILVLTIRVSIMHEVEVGLCDFYRFWLLLQFFRLIWPT